MCACTSGRFVPSAGMTGTGGNDLVRKQRRRDERHDQRRLSDGESPTQALQPTLHDRAQQLHKLPSRETARVGDGEEHVGRATYRGHEVVWMRGGCWRPSWIRNCSACVAPGSLTLGELCVVALGVEIQHLHVLASTTDHSNRAGAVLTLIRRRGNGHRLLVVVRTGVWRDCRGFGLAHQQ